MMREIVAATVLAAGTPVEAEPRPSVAPRKMQAIAPALAGYTDDVLFGHVWRRPDLLPRDRSLVTIAVLAAGGDGDQLAFHIQRGLDNGLTQGEIVEAFTHVAFYAGWPKASAAIAVAGKVFGKKETTAMSDIQIVKPGRSPAAGPTSYFTGAVTVTSPFKGTGDARLGGATVTFQPGARTNWHTHPLGQLLIVTQGRGWVQSESRQAQEYGPGDTVWIAPGVKHWHGATRSSAMTHVAVAEALDGPSVTWLEPVSDADYHGPQ